MPLKILDSLQEMQTKYKGMLLTPTFTDNGNGTITIGTYSVNIYDNATNGGVPKTYLIPGATLTPTDNALSYIGALFNGGSPAFQIVTDRALFELGTHVPIFTVYRNGIHLHVTNWDSLGVALPEKIFFAAASTYLRFIRANGLDLSEYGTRNVKTLAGRVYEALSVPLDLDEVNSATDNIVFCYHVAGVWTESTVTQYNNTQYDDGTALVSLGAAKYAVNWVYRGIESQKDIYITLGTGNYNLVQAQAAQPPTHPPLISSHAMLVGRIIVVLNGATATQIDSVFITAFSASPSTDHASLSNLAYATSGHTGFVPVVGTTMTGALIADENTDYTTAQMRNVIESVSAPSGGQNGDVWIKYNA
jgi:hypothetical protein